jgi:hypothetical protein
MFQYAKISSFLGVTLLLISLKISNKNNDVIILRFYDITGRVITKGNVYFLTNDLSINDISLDELKRQEKLGIGKLTPKGIYTIDRRYLNKNYNKSNKDSLSALFRCDNTYGEVFRFKISDDTANIYGLHSCANLK